MQKEKRTQKNIGKVGNIQQSGGFKPINIITLSLSGQILQLKGRDSQIECQSNIQLYAGFKMLINLTQID